MADDLGHGDVGFGGHPTLRTPHLDAMAGAGLRFERFYAAAPVCSPTRGSCLTGRHPFRYGIVGANRGHLLLRARGYRAGHFGKWHLGTLTKTQRDSNRGGPRGAAHYAPPWQHGFEVCFSTEAKVPTWDPMRDPASGEPYGTAYWREDGSAVAEHLDGDDSRVMMDRVLPFVRDAVRGGQPFFAVVWFHAPHLPEVGGPEHRALYPELDGAAQHYHACVSALDEQIGRLRAELRALEVEGDTMLWFCSDNGPEGDDRAPGSTGGLRGRKRSLFEGGVRVPGIVEWPARVAAGGSTAVPACTSDYLPTILEAVDIEPPDPRPIDGVSLLPLLDGRMRERPRPIAFESGRQLALIGNRFKIVRAEPPVRGGGMPARPTVDAFALFDLVVDPGESASVADRHPEVRRQMFAALEEWRLSCARSRGGADY